MIKQESAKNKDDPANAKLWEQKLKQPGLTYYLKKGNSKVRPTQPYFRSDFTFNRKYQMQKLVKCVSNLFITLMLADLLPRGSVQMGQECREGRIHFVQRGQSLLWIHICFEQEACHYQSQRLL